MTISWDCFDTLVTRVRLDPLSVFDWMGERYELPDFTRRRKAAESQAPWTLDSIYNELAKDYQWDESTKNYYKTLEIEAEVEHCKPIVENLQKVKDGDLIVSDMYLPEWAIRRILENCGLTKNVQIFVTTGGKSSGRIWHDLPPIDLHIGDNWHSDVGSPQGFGIKAQHYTDVHCSPLEQLVGEDLGLLMRAVRLANPYDQETKLHRMWFEQAQFNIPALVLASASLPKENLAFVHRDCVHLQRIHERLHSTVNATFHCSRIAMEERGDTWDAYVKETAKGRTIVDLQGTGASVAWYWQHAFNETPDLLYVTGMMRAGRALVTIPTDVIERFNSSPLGSLGKFPERFPNEFDEEVLACQKLAIDTAVEYMPYFNLEVENLALLSRLIVLMYHSSTPLWNNHQSNHKQSSLDNDWPAERVLDDTLAIGIAFQ